MMSDLQDVVALVDRYVDAWVTKDSRKILTVFTEDAVYQEWAFSEPFVGHEGISRYWDDKVVAGQDNIQVEVLEIQVMGACAYAEWEAEFDDNVAGCRRLMKEVALLKLRDGKICSLREYWASKAL